MDVKLCRRKKKELQNKQEAVNIFYGKDYEINWCKCRRRIKSNVVKTKNRGTKWGKNTIYPDNIIYIIYFKFHVIFYIIRDA